MSDDQLDNEFKNRIKQVFDNYEDDSGAEGWALLREKFPEKKSDRVVAWLWRYAGVAAILLAVLSVALWFHLQHKSKQNLVVKNNSNRPAVAIKAADVAKNKPNSTNSGSKVAYQTPVSPLNSARSSVRSAAITPAVVQPSHNPVSIVNNTKKYTAHNNAKNITTHKPAVNNAAYIIDNSPKGAIASAKPAVGNTPVYPNVNNTTGTMAAVKPAAKVSAAAILSADTAKTTKVAAIPANGDTKAPSVVLKKHPDIQSLFDNDNKYNTAKNNTADTKIKNRAVVFGVYAATYVNYAKGSNNQFNTGAGFSADIRLNENLSIVTGVAIAQNSFSYNSLTSNSPILFAATASRNFQPTMFALDQVSPTSKNLDANLVGLDVPVDLKYMFNPQSSSAYVSAGLSSGGFLNETYNYTFSYNVDNNPTNQQSQGATSRRSFDDFYVAKMLNLSFGMGYPLGKGNQLIIEPFFKYPLNGLGDQHILFGSGGLNLKLNFDPPRGKR